MKLKVAFTIDSKTLFQILAKALPLEDLRVEEQLDEAELHQALKKMSGLDKFALPAKIARAKPAQFSKKRKRAAIPFNPDGGINKIILTLLAKGPHRAIEMRSLLKEGGYSPTSASSRLQELLTRGMVIKHGDGLWSLTETTTQEDKRA